MACYCPHKQNYALYLDCKECEERLCDALFCLVAGSRHFRDYELLETRLNALFSRQSNVVIVSGGAAGTDSLAERYAREHGYKCIVFPADWEKHGVSAGYIRNRMMHEYISKMPKRGCVLFWDGKSKGTGHSISLAKSFGNPIRIINIEESTEM